SPQGEAFLALRRAHHPIPLVSPQRNGGSPAGATTQEAAGRWRSHRARETGKKKDLKPRNELARTFDFRFFSYSLP
ncbi:MAG: hypothetical protein IJA59_00105, partial [Clostridia bacterium]|nr:hypothetical protein [Clostridia bacterium]